jgi:uncharacterized protein (UPF0333 family)
MNNKGQGAMEYLMTYGWAILVVVIIGGVMWYLGFFGDRYNGVCDDFCGSLNMSRTDFSYRGCACMQSNCTTFMNKSFCSTFGEVDYYTIDEVEK